MAKSKIGYWLGEGRESLEEIVFNARTDKEIYTAMGISCDTYYKYLNKAEFSEVIKKIRLAGLEERKRKLRTLQEDMWKDAHEQVIEETVKEVWSDDKSERKYVKTVTKKLPGDTTLQIYLDKTYGNNINYDEVESRVELNKLRIETQKALLNPEVDEGTKVKLEAVRQILGGVDSVIGKAK